MTHKEEIQSCDHCKQGFGMATLAHQIRQHCLHPVSEMQSRSSHMYGSHRVQGLILEIGVSSVAHQGRPRIPVNGKSTKAQTCTRTLLDIAKDLEGHYWGRWCEKIGLDTLVSPLTSNLFLSPHTCDLKLICRPMALLYGAITHWNWMRAGWSCIVSTERHGEAPHFTLLNASSLTLSKSRE